MSSTKIYAFKAPLELEQALGELTGYGKKFKNPSQLMRAIVMSHAPVARTLSEIKKRKIANRT